MPLHPDEFHLPEDQLRLIAESESSGRWMRPLAEEVLTLRVRLDRVTDLFEKWAAEESEHRAAGEYGIAEGFRVAIEELRLAVHGTTEPVGGAR